VGLIVPVSAAVTARSARCRHRWRASRRRGPPVRFLLLRVATGRGGTSTIHVNGQRVGWHVYGDPAGRPVLFMHGWGMRLTGYRRALDMLARSGWAVHACNLAGFGRSEPLPVRRSSLGGYAELVAAAHLVGPLGGQPVPVVGHSFGAGIAALAAARDLTTFAALLLVCPVGGAGSSVWSWLSLARGWCWRSTRSWRSGRRTRRPRCCGIHCPCRYRPTLPRRRISPAS
jgi:pimeloyl-ACP methyl ester carboxylesterase